MTPRTTAHRTPLGPPPGSYAALARGCRPRGCRAPARRVHGRRVRYHIGCEPGQINGRRWRADTAADAPAQHR
ncbi:tryptophan biosynthesis modulator TrpM [Streptomyces sp. Amel2xB2]|uniref:tryptophan biosynthesis modulator TrpM n=1 Tax=Streptomyces sp. Amel2xB2 TaxID=1305829 RepID=UPI000DBA2E33|nr:tryptophan synthase subunit(beta) [Streptomyces sp. Amel2xB2]